MKFILMLMLAIAANSAWAHVEVSRHALPNAEHVSAPAAGFELLSVSAQESVRCGQHAHLALWSDAAPGAGASDAYCSKMAQCCATGVSSCCVNYNKYCNR
jgi:hypothetical protein